MRKLFQIAGLCWVLLSVTYPSDYPKHPPAPEVCAYCAEHAIGDDDPELCDWCYLHKVP